MQQNEKNFSLKDQLFNAEKVAYLAGLFQAADAKFPVDAFQQQVMAELPNLELKASIAHIATCLMGSLDADYPAALQVIVQALPPELDPTLSDDDFGDFIIAPLSHAVAEHGCKPQYVDQSLAALREITKRFSAEYAIRDFINAFPDQTMAFVQACASDSNYHVRRLASEGTRPKLPWGKGITLDYQVMRPILTQLHADPTRFVTRSVANHLNDVSKIDPEWVVTYLQEWQVLAQQTPKELAYIKRHALRTLIKQGHAGAMELLGFTASPQFNIRKLAIHSAVVAVGDAAEFTLQFESLQAQKLSIDYVMEYAATSASRKPSRKIYKLKQLSVAKGEVVQLNKRHPFKLMTTRRLALGPHTVTILINGQALTPLQFELTGS